MPQTTAILPAGACDGALVHVVRNFTPNWFTAVMGTGIVALVLNQASGGPLAHAVGCGLWLAASVLMLLFSALYGARWALFSSGARRILDHPVMSLFLSAIPMALATVCNGVIAFGPDLLGSAAIPLARGLFRIDVALSVGCGVLVPFWMITRQAHSADALTALWLLPVVACEVAAVSGAQLVPRLSDPVDAFRLLILDYALWALSVPLALGLLVLLLFRLMLHKLPPASVAASSWLALGPIGTGALGLVLLGRDAGPACLAVGLSFLGPVLHGFGLVGGVLLWGYGMWWLLFAVLATARYLRQGMPFNLGWWGFVFPPGVFILATLAIGRDTGIALFNQLGAAGAMVLVPVWLLVAVLTARGAVSRALFVAPCLQDASAPRAVA